MILHHFNLLIQLRKHPKTRHLDWYGSICHPHIHPLLFYLHSLPTQKLGFNKIPTQFNQYSTHFVLPYTHLITRPWPDPRRSRRPWPPAAAAASAWRCASRRWPPAAWSSACRAASSPGDHRGPAHHGGRRWLDNKVESKDLVMIYGYMIYDIWKFMGIHWGW